MLPTHCSHNQNSSRASWDIVDLKPQEETIQKTDTSIEHSSEGMVMLNPTTVRNRKTLIHDMAWKQRWSIRIELELRIGTYSFDISDGGNCHSLVVYLFLLSNGVPHWNPCEQQSRWDHLKDGNINRTQSIKNRMLCVTGNSFRAVQSWSYP